MTKLVCVCVAVCAMMAAPARSEQVIASPLSVDGGVEAPPGAVVVRVDLGAVKGLLTGVPVRMVGFPLGPGRLVELDVRRFEVLAPDAIVVEGTAEGDRAMRWPEVVLLRGSVRGADESRVYLALSEFGCNGFIEADGETFIIAGKSAVGDVPAEPTVVYSTAQLPEGLLKLHDHVCGGAIEGEPGEDEVVSPAGASVPCRVVRVAMDGDFEYFRDVFSGSSSAAQAYTITLIGGVAEIYRSNLNVTLQVGFSRVWTTSSDPYPDGSVSGSLLSSMRSWWNSNMSGTPRNNAHLLTSSARSGGAGGIAYLSSICQGGNSYGISGFINGSFPNPLALRSSGNWDLVVVAHEMGHNFAAGHTHSLSPPVDGCGLEPQDCSQATQGTIMSYCHTCSGGVGNITLNFHARNINEQMLPYLAGGASGCVQSGGAGSCTAQIVNINARTTCSASGGVAQVILGNGTFALEPVDVAGGGAYNGWSPWGSNSGCSNGCCTQGYVWRYEFNTGQAWTPVGLPGCNRSTDTSAFTNQSQMAMVTVPAQAITQFRVSDGGCNDNRGGVSVRVVRCPQITFNPTNRFNCAPVSSVSFAVSAEGDDLAYQWFHNGQALVNDAQYSGATSRVLVIDRPVGPEAGLYHCAVSNSCGEATSATALLSLSNFGPIILDPPEGATIEAGQSAMLSVVVTGAGNVTYRWRRNGVNLNDGGKFSGVTTPTLMIESASTSEAGTYQCELRDSCGLSVTAPVDVVVESSTTCPADFNADGNLDPDDLGDFINCFFGPGCASADFNGDGNVDPDDLGDFINVFFAGCP
ncbi:MAG: M12 family metallo-peptidase [Phycisphaerales bacterium]